MVFRRLQIFRVRVVYMVGVGGWRRRDARAGAGGRAARGGGRAGRPAGAAAAGGVQRQLGRARRLALQHRAPPE